MIHWHSRPLTVGLVFSSDSRFVHWLRFSHCSHVLIKSKINMPFFLQIRGCLCSNVTVNKLNQALVTASQYCAPSYSMMRTANLNMEDDPDPQAHRKQDPKYDLITQQYTSTELGTSQQRVLTYTANSIQVRGESWQKSTTSNQRPKDQSKPVRWWLLFSGRC